MKVELLYFDGCPNYEAFVSHLRELMDRAAVDAELELRRVESDADARRLRFLGSPTVRVDGRDVEPEADGRRTYALQCRLYRSPDRVSGVPPDELIVRALGSHDAWGG